MYGTFISCAARIFLPTDSFASSTVDAQPGRARRRGELLAALDVPVGDGHQPELLGREPQRERAGVVLGEHAEEAFDRAEQRAVDHDRPVPRVVGARVVQVEALRHLEVDLDRRHLPRAADRVPRLHADLRAVEGAAALVQHELGRSIASAASRSASMPSAQSSSVPTALPSGFVESSR